MIQQRLRQKLLQASDPAAFNVLSKLFPDAHLPPHPNSPSIYPPAGVSGLQHPAPAIAPPPPPLRQVGADSAFAFAAGQSGGLAVSGERSATEDIACTGVPWGAGALQQRIRQIIQVRSRSRSIALRPDLFIDKDSAPH